MEQLEQDQASSELSMMVTLGTTLRGYRPTTPTYDCSGAPVTFGSSHGSLLPFWRHRSSEANLSHIKWS
jgi:hypothetical protein